MLFDEPWPADDTAKSTSFSLPSRGSLLRFSLDTLLGRHSSTVSRACLSKSLNALPDAIWTYSTSWSSAYVKSGVMQEPRNLGREWHFECPLLTVLPFRHRSRHCARQTSTDCFILGLQQQCQMVAAGVTIPLISLSVA